MPRSLCAFLLCSLTLTGCGLTPWYARVSPSPQPPYEAASSSDFAYRQHPDMMTREAALAILLRATIFEDVFAGDGEQSIQVIAFQHVLLEPDALAAFGEMVRRGKIAGQLYGLSGLYLTNRAAFDREIGRYRNSTEDVDTLSGCIGDTEHVSGVAARIASGDIPQKFAYPVLTKFEYRFY